MPSSLFSPKIMYAAVPPSAALAGEPLHSQRLVLRPYLPTDQADFFALLDASRARLRPSFPAREAAVQTPLDAARVLATFHHDWQAGHLYVLGIWLRATGQYLGDISLKPNWAGPITVEIGYYLAPEAEGHGYAREALRAVLPFGFGTLGATRLLVRCRTNNPRSCAVAEAVGFTLLPPRPRPWPLRKLNPAESEILYYSLRLTDAGDASLNSPS
ncbi:GNAT family N-acetyltransferase [Hymenobacter weizhouensis]|uniref:GNAT family N-acetyltransferase n=1 Tax=Hymenobacter sp. YIM 151500-1 TaxID=2987689 RepID=UPI002227A291|nr:GNAT family N-acetyltransferase [Hymenobacter sp. YIM 151500-1]UYZ62991.1 GNAT family N-acetyltransferase [Hymenobacter sp. YIM 151500-1]